MLNFMYIFTNIDPLLGVYPEIELIWNSILCIKSKLPNEATLLGIINTYSNKWYNKKLKGPYKEKII